jgi:uncharacterized membrane protein YdbT with pleckstrin-like domain
MQAVPVLKPSQWINAGYIIFGVLGAPLIFPTLLMAYRMAEVYFWRYEFHEHYLIERKGVFGITRRELHYHRIKGIREETPFLYRLVGITTIQVVSSDPFTAYFQLIAVPGDRQLPQALREVAATGRRTQKVRELDVYSLG